LTKAKTAQQVIEFMANHRLDPTPRNYTLGYMLVTKASAPLEKAVRAIADDGLRITQEQADEILDSCGVAGVPGGGTPNVADGEEALLHQMLRIGDIANSSRAAAGDFGRDLDAQMGALAGNPEVTAVVAGMVLRSRRTEQELAASMDEITRLRQDLESARDDANRDKLSGLPNRRALDERLAQLERSGATYSVAICDIDKFKSVNDTHGHGVGDRVIKAVGQVIAEACRGHLVGRWGGEEFMAVFEGLDPSRAAELVNEARETLEVKTFKLRDTDQPLGKITFSAGIASEATTAEAARVADLRLYAAKEGGRNQVVHTGGGIEKMRKAA